MLRLNWRLVPLALMVLACGKNSNEPSGDGTGTVRGTITAADGTTPVQGAEVKVQGSGNLQQVAQLAAPSVDTTDAQGQYELVDVPTGSQTLVASKGLFRATFTVNVKESGVTTVTQPTKLQPQGALAYVEGVFDNIQAVITGLGYTATAITEADLANPNVTNNYVAIFLNCGLDDFTITNSAPTLANLRTWIENGGLLYASDWALTVVQALYPTAMDGLYEGEVGDVTAQITDARLQASLGGRSSVTIRYDLGAWKTATTLAASTRVLIRGVPPGETTQQTLAAEFDAGEGRVVFTSFHNEAGATEDQYGVLRYYLFSD